MHFLFLLLFSIIAKDGSCIDPNGARYVRTADAGDGRSIIDPIGRTGTCVDPNGIRCSRGFADDGIGIDPNG